MMRCIHCNRDYLGGQRFCHQCGEPLRPHDTAAERPAARGVSDAITRRARTTRRRRASQPSSSLLFAILVLVGAGAGLAIVWHQRWMPPALRASARLSGEPAQQPADTISAEEPRAQASAPAPESEGPAATPASTPSAEPAPAPVAAPAPSPPPRKAVEPAPAPSLAPKPVPESAPARVAAIPNGPAPTTPRPARSVAPASEPSTGTRILSVRADPGSPSAPTGARVVPLVPVTPGTGARGQLMWESMGGGVLIVSGLPQPPIGRTYQLWLGSISLGNRISGGLVAVDSQGAGTLRVAPPRATWAPDIFGVTMERQGGAREPSDDLVLVGELPKQSGAAVPPAAPVFGASAPTASAETRPGGAPGSASASAAETLSSTPPPPRLVPRGGPTASWCGSCRCRSSGPSRSPSRS